VVSEIFGGGNPTISMILKRQGLDAILQAGKQELFCYCIKEINQMGDTI